MNQKGCVEPYKRLKKNALVNACIPKDSAARKGSFIITKVTPEIRSLISIKKEDFQKSWEEGEGITIVKARMGKELYAESLACGYLGNVFF